MYVEFENMPQQSRIWVYQAERTLSTEEVNFVKENCVAFLQNWTAHNNALKSSFDIKYNQFLILSVDESQAGASGCSIDKSVHFIQWLEQQMKISFLDRTKLAFLQDNEVSMKSLNAIKNAIADGEVGQETLTFNNFVGTKADLESDWIVPARESWMKRYFNN